MQQRSPAFFAMIALGVILLVAGIVYGLGSRHVQYKSVPQGSIVHYLSADGTGYLQMEGNIALYIVHEDNFSPKLAPFADSDTVSFVYDPAETTSIDERSTLGTHLVGTASKVVAITAIDAANGRKTYTTPEYTSNPTGYDHNQWPLGIGLLVVGLLLIGGSFFLPRKKRLEATAAPLVTPGVPVSAFQQNPAYSQNTPPYGQPIQPIQQGYPQNYPPQAKPFQQMPQPGYPPQPFAPFGPSQQQQPKPFGQPQQSDTQNQPPQQQKFGTFGQYRRPKPTEPPQQ